MKLTSLASTTNAPFDADLRLANALALGNGPFGSSEQAVYCPCAGLCGDCCPL